MPRQLFSLGYNLAEESSITINQFSINGRSCEIGQVPGEPLNVTEWWLPTSQTTISLQIELDVLKIYEDCALSSSDELFITLHSYSSGTKMQHCGTPTKVGGSSLEIELEIPANEWAEEATLQLTLTVRFAKGISRGVGAPAIPNSRLMERDWKIQLSGSRTQGNVVIRDFSKDPRITNAIWNIKIDRRVEMDAWPTVQHSNVLRVEINKNFEEFVNQTQVQTLLLTDIIMLALGDVIDDDEKLEFIRSDSLANGSWVRFLKTVYGIVFSVGEIMVRDKWHNEQQEIRARVQHLTSTLVKMS